MAIAAPPSRPIPTHPKATLARTTEAEPKVIIHFLQVREEDFAASYWETKGKGF